MEERAIPLKRSPRRTVEVLRAEVVKRYHHPGRFARLLDRSRAAQELATLRELQRRGVAVPRPIEVRRSAGGFELVTERIPGAVPLERSAPTPALVRALARTLAAAQLAGLAHRDLHPGNLVLGGDGRVYLVDVRGARIGRGFDARRARRDLVALASSVRERVPAALRARFLVAWSRALPLERREARSELAREVEAAARIHRREAVRRARKRWTRLSSVCRPVSGGFASVELADLPEDRVVVLRDRPWRELLRAWYQAARLAEHGIPCARPRLLARAPERSATFALPDGARADDARADARARAAIEALLLDRGLGLSGARDELRVDRAGRAWIGPLPLTRLVDRDEEDAAT